MLSLYLQCCVCSIKSVALLQSPLHHFDEARLSQLHLPKLHTEVGCIHTVFYKSRKKNPQKLTQLSSRSHPRHLVGKRTAQKDITIDTTSDSQVNSNFPNRWSPASLTFNNYFYLFLYLYMFGAKWESVRFRNCPAQSRNSHFVVQFRNCAGTILELRKGFWYFAEQVKVCVQNGHLWDKVGI